MPRYLRPPIIERVASVWAPMTPEVYEGRFEQWRADVEQELPVYEPVKRWLINVKEKDGIPLYDTMQPELQISPRFSKKTSKEGFDWSLRCPSGQLTLNMHSTPGDRRGYQMLKSALARWLPRWMDHFSVSEPAKISLFYVNRLDGSTIPSFATPRVLHIEKVLKVFVQVPGEHVTLVPPWDCQATVQLKDRKDAALNMHLHGEPERLSVRMDFNVEITPQAGENSPDALLGLFDWAHERIIDRFEAVFTPEAKKSFEIISDGPSDSHLRG